MIPLLLLLLHLLSVISPSELIQVEVKGLATIEAFVRLWNGRLLALNLLNLIKVLLQVLARIWRAVPALRLLNDCSDSFILNHRVHVDGVVHTAENAVLVGVAHV